MLSTRIRFPNAVDVEFSVYAISLFFCRCCVLIGAVHILFSSAAPLLSYLSTVRRQQLQNRPDELRAAESALAAVTKVRHHPSRELLERLIADGAAWTTMLRKSKTPGRRNWEALLATQCSWQQVKYMAITLQLRATLAQKGMTINAAAAVIRLAYDSFREGMRTLHYCSLSILPQTFVC